MQRIIKLILGCCLTVLAGSYAVAQPVGGFESKSSFPEGAGDPSRSYGVIIPDKVTVELPDGTVLEPGTVVEVPGQNITVIDVDDSQIPQDEPETFHGFDRETTFTATPITGKGVVAVAINITTPGVVVRHEDGREATTGDTIKLLVLHEDIRQTEPQETAPTGWQGWPGFESK